MSPKYLNQSLTEKDRLETLQSEIDGSGKRRNGPAHVGELAAELQTQIDRTSKPLPKKPNAKPVMEFSPSELDALRAPIAAMGFDLELEILERLIAISKTYRVSGFVISAALHRAVNKVAKTPSYRPKSAAWFGRVAENELKARGVAN